MKFLLLLIIPIYKYLINSYRLNRIEELYKKLIFQSLFTYLKMCAKIILLGG